MQKSFAPGKIDKITDKVITAPFGAVFFTVFDFDLKRVAVFGPLGLILVAFVTGVTYLC